MTIFRQKRPKCAQNMFPGVLFKMGFYCFDLVFDWGSINILRGWGCIQEWGCIQAGVVLFQNNLKVNLIDFDDSGFGFRIFDLATTLLHFINDKNFNKIQDQLTKGYLDTNFLNLKLFCFK